MHEHEIKARESTSAKKRAKNQGAQERESANAKTRNLRPKTERKSASAKTKKARAQLWQNLAVFTVYGT
jgi:hypothetical protein